jgi:hypothetical protein
MAKFKIFEMGDLENLEEDVLDEEGLVGNIAKAAVPFLKREVPGAVGLSVAGSAVNAALEKRNKIAQGIKEENKISENKREIIKMDKLEKTMNILKEEIVSEIKEKNLKRIKENLQNLSEGEYMTALFARALKSANERLVQSHHNSYIKKMEKLNAQLEKATDEKTKLLINSKKTQLEAWYHEVMTALENDAKEVKGSASSIIDSIKNVFSGEEGGGWRGMLGKTEVGKAMLPYLDTAINQARGQTRAGDAIEKAKEFAKQHPYAAGAAAAGTVYGASKLIDRNKQNA